MVKRRKIPRPIGTRSLGAPRASTIEDSEKEQRNGVAVAVNEVGNVVMLGMVDGTIEWGQEMEPTLAEQIGGCLIAKANEARRRVPS